MVPANGVSGQTSAVISITAGSNLERPTSKSEISTRSSTNSSQGRGNKDDRTATNAPQSVCDPPQLSAPSNSNDYEHSALASVGHYDYGSSTIHMFQSPFWGGTGPASMYSGAPYFGTPYVFPKQMTLGDSSS
jgi:hypothetical protein